jgi:hypothetical protein
MTILFRDEDEYLDRKTPQYAVFRQCSVIRERLSLTARYRPCGRTLVIQRWAHSSIQTQRNHHYGAFTSTSTALISVLFGIHVTGSFVFCPTDQQSPFFYTTATKMRARYMRRGEVNEASHLQPIKGRRCSVSMGSQIKTPISFVVKVRSSSPGSQANFKIIPCFRCVRFSLLHPRRNVLLGVNRINRATT